MSLVSVNPATGRRLPTYREHTGAAGERALARVSAAQRSWRALSSNSANRGPRLEQPFHARDDGRAIAHGDTREEAAREIQTALQLALDT